MMIIQSWNIVQGGRLCTFFKAFLSLDPLIVVVIGVGYTYHVLQAVIVSVASLGTVVSLRQG